MLHDGPATLPVLATTEGGLATASDWIDRYQGNGRRGFREGTRDDYRRLLAQYAHSLFGERLRLVYVTPRTLAQWVAWLVGGAGLVLAERRPRRMLPRSLPMSDNAPDRTRP